MRIRCWNGRPLPERQSPRCLAPASVRVAQHVLRFVGVQGLRTEALVPTEADMLARSCTTVSCIDLLRALVVRRERGLPYYE